MRLFVLAGLALAIAPASSDAKCAFWGLTPKVVSGDIELPADGGIVVALDPTMDGKLDPGDGVVQPTWKLRVGKTRVAPVIEVLAPGLAVYRAPAGTAGAFQLDNGTDVVGKARAGTAKRDKLAAPVVKTIIYEGTVGGRRPSANITLTFDGGIPTGAVAIVIADAKGTPRSFGTIERGKDVIGFSRERCMAMPNGTVESKPGDKVVVYWIDEAGRRSDATKPIAVGGKVQTLQGGE
jgi:hypothetical protein